MKLIRSWTVVSALGIALITAAGAQARGPKCVADKPGTTCPGCTADPCPACTEHSCPACCEEQDSACPGCCEGKAKGCGTTYCPECADGACCEKCGKEAKTCCKSKTKSCCTSSCETDKEGCACSCSSSCCKDKKDACCGSCCSGKKKCCEHCAEGYKCCCGESKADTCACSCEGKGCKKHAHGKSDQKKILETLTDIRDILEDGLSAPPPWVMVPPPAPPGAYEPIGPAYGPPVPPPPPVPCMVPPMPRPAWDCPQRVCPPPCPPAPQALVPASCPSMVPVAACPAAERCRDAGHAWVVCAVERAGKTKLEIGDGCATCMTCREMDLSVAGCGGLKVCACDKQVAITGTWLEAAADRVTRADHDRLILDGHVKLTYHKDGQRAEVTAEHVAVGLTDGRVEIAPGKAGPHVAGDKEPVCPVSCILQGFFR